MIETVISQASGNWIWLDIINPTKKDLNQLAQKYGLHNNLVKDCLDPEHLPKYERYADVHFLILRSFDENCNQEADEVVELTRKIAIFFSDSFLITIHRKEQSFLTKIKNDLKEKQSEVSQQNSMIYIVAEILEQVAHTYEKPIDNAFLELEKIEHKTIKLDALDSDVLQKGYYIKRRATVFKRMFRMSVDVLNRVNFLLGDEQKSKGQDIKENIENLFFYVDQLLDDTNNLLNLHISISSQRTNEVMRLLTIFSLFFLPLNFIASIYGMNFEFMPELKWEFGYYTVLAFMCLIALLILLWFKRKKWL